MAESSIGEKRQFDGSDTSSDEHDVDLQGVKVSDLDMSRTSKWRLVKRLREEADNLHTEVDDITDSDAHDTAASRHLDTW